VTPAPTLLATLGLGFSLGLVHALDADHLVAVTTLVSEGRSPRRSALVGVVWGLGHAASLLAVGLVAVGLGWVMPSGFTSAAELGVAFMLVGLGVQAIRRGLHGVTMHVHMHAHGGQLHAHRHLHLGPGAAHEGVLHALAHVGRRPFLVGLVHGLAGSGALVIVVAGAMLPPGLALLCIALFGLGAAVAMGVVAMLVAWPLRLARSALPSVSRTLVIAVGTGSVVYGAALGAHTLVAQGLLG
jgi:hypothetical protein